MEGGSTNRVRPLLPLLRRWNEKMRNSLLALPGAGRSDRAETGSNLNRSVRDGPPGEILRRLKPRESAEWES